MYIMEKHAVKFCTALVFQGHLISMHYFTLAKQDAQKCTNHTTGHPEGNVWCPCPLFTIFSVQCQFFHQSTSVLFIKQQITVDLSCSSVGISKVNVMHKVQKRKNCVSSVANIPFQSPINALYCGAIWNTYNSHFTVRLMQRVVFYAAIW